MLRFRRDDDNFFWFSRLHRVRLRSKRMAERIKRFFFCFQFFLYISGRDRCSDITILYGWDLDCDFSYARLAFSSNILFFLINTRVDGGMACQLDGPWQYICRVEGNVM